MTDGRRKADDRRGQGGSPNRRTSDDRRYAEGRRAAGATAPEPGKKTRKKTAKAVAKSKEKGRVNWPAIFKRVAIAFMLASIFFTVVIIYFFSHLDFYVNKLGQRVNLAIEKISLDPESLTDRTTRARLSFRVKNTLPLDILLQNLTFNVHLTGYTVAKGMQTMPKALINGHSEVIVPVACNVDSIMTRRALQKAKEAKLAPSKGLADRFTNRKDNITDNLKGVVRIDGKAEFRLLAAGVEIPFSRSLILEK